jgi:2-dehydro-3-deoxyphosphogluconate aldolase/(4S)-4-hydroxy-2-oxoglutarate aldolase
VRTLTLSDPTSTDSVLDLAPVIPVVVMHHLATAVPLARALVAGGLPAIEVTLRTPDALSAIAQIADQVPDAVVGAGTVLSPADVTASVAAGARFLVSPGSTPLLLDAMDEAAANSGVASLPGAATASEVLALLERGRREVKFFPAADAGGSSYLKSLGGPLHAVRFCPTGGIDRTTAPAYLALPNVACVGGSWVTPKDAVAAGDWARIEQLAREAAGLRAA